MTHTVDQQDIIIESKHSIYRDALMGFLTSIGVGLIASVLFVLIVLFLSSNALAQSAFVASAHLCDFDEHYPNFSSQRLGAHGNVPAGTSSLLVTSSTAVCACEVQPTSNFINAKQVQSYGHFRFKNAITDNMYRLGSLRIDKSFYRNHKQPRKIYSLVGLRLYPTQRFVPDTPTVPESNSSPDNGTVGVFNVYLSSENTHFETKVQFPNSRRTGSNMSVEVAKLHQQRALFSLRHGFASVSAAIDCSLDVLPVPTTQI